jgi:hypothetical protein
MTVGKITYDKLESQAYNNIYSILDTRTNVADPRDPGNNKIRRFVYDTDPFEKRIDFALLPYVIVTLPVMVYEGKTADGSKKFITWRHKIVVRSAVRGVSNFNDELGRTDVLAIGDSLNKIFNSSAGLTTLRGYRMQKVNLTKDDTDVLVFDGKDMYEANYTLEYETLMDVIG